MKNIEFYIPALNSGNYLERCILSILRIKDTKVFVIDGGSCDNTREIAKKYRIKVIRQDGTGLAAARNTAIRHARAEFIAFIDSDCEIDRKWPESVFRHFRDEKIAGVCGRVIEKIQDTIPDRWRKFHLRQDWGDKRSNNVPFLFGSNFVFRVSSLDLAGGFNERYMSNYEDVDISFRLKKLGMALAYEPHAICYHNRKDNLVSIIKTAKQWSFFSYPVPETLVILLARLFIYNPHLLFAYCLAEAKKFRFDLMPIALLSFFYGGYHDISYFMKKE